MIENPEAIALVQDLRAYVHRSTIELGGSTKAIKPSHRVKFLWPPHPISYSFHVLASDWTGRSTAVLHGETFEIEVARTAHGVFVRCEAIWHEERGETLDEAVKNLEKTSRPLFDRQLATARALEREGRFTGHIRDLAPIELLKLLFCEDRDVANDAHTEIETHASQGIFLPALLEILVDNRHPYRRSAQWCVLDLFEDLPSFCDGAEDEAAGVEAMKRLIWDAEDDYARTVYKAGVVLGGHLPHKLGGTTLIDCLQAPSRIGRRSAIHGLFHVVEWIPEMRDQVVSALKASAQNDPEPILREYAASMASDIEAEETEHVPDPVFPDEP